MTRTVDGPIDHVVVVGAGLAGLSAALHLLGAGRRVTLLERAEHPGGLAGRLDLRTERGSYLVDPGPTVLTMPHLLDEAFAAVGERLTDRLELVPLDPAYRAHFADGSTIDVRPGAADMAAEVARACGPGAVGGYLRLREWLERLYRTEIDGFIGANHDSPLGLLGPDLARLVAMGGFAGLDGQVARFVPDERLRRLFTFQALYAGVPPKRALGAYGVIAYMDTVAGVSFPRGGMRQVGTALAAAATKAGAELHLGRTATGLRRAHGRVTGVRHAATDDPGGPSELVDCDAVVLACDLDQAYRLTGHRPRRPVRLRRSPSAVVLHLGLRRARPELAHHTISFGQAWEQTFREIVELGVPMSDPSLLVTRPTATDPTLAPPGGDLLFVLAPCPNLDTGWVDWRKAAPHYRDEILATLAARGHPGLDDVDGDVEIERVVTPHDWAVAGLAAGTPFALAHTLAQTGPFRPGNLVAGLGNAVLAGCGTTPGVGIPPVVISGRLAAARITGA